jgi:hypothetical protein
MPVGGEMTVRLWPSVILPEKRTYLRAGMSLRGAAGDEAISFPDRDCFAEFILSGA